jgi:hypothetical protein
VDQEVVDQEDRITPQIALEVMEILHLLAQAKETMAALAEITHHKVGILEVEVVVLVL